MVPPFQRTMTLLSAREIMEKLDSTSAKGSHRRKRQATDGENISNRHTRSRTVIPDIQRTLKLNNKKTNDLV